MDRAIDREHNLRWNNSTNVTFLNSAANSHFYGGGI